LRRGVIGGSRSIIAPRRFGAGRFTNRFGRGRGLGLYYGGYYPGDYGCGYSSPYYAYPDCYGAAPYVASDYAAPAPVDPGYNYYPQYAPPAALALTAPQPPPTPVTLTRIVFKDHTTQTAVAYSLDRGNLVYINEAGARRTVPMDQVDMEASRKMNQDRGVTFDPRS